MASLNLRTRVKEGLMQVATAATAPSTSRSALLALSELARRHGGDVPTGGEVADLTLYELRVFSQNGEDGVLAEILRRCGAPGRHFVEFGAGFGVENNCAVLADVLGWHGLYLEGGEREYQTLERKYRAIDGIKARREIVTPENVEQVFDREGVPEEPDVLSIDVDGTDYWIWEAIERHRPRVVVIEYNGALEPRSRLVQPREHPGWDHATTYYGASLGALVTLGERKGYRHVYCELSGNNAFFVRADLPGAFPDPADVVPRAANFWLLGAQHRPDPAHRAFLDLDA